MRVRSEKGSFFEGSLFEREFSHVHTIPIGEHYIYIRGRLGFCIRVDSKELQHSEHETFLNLEGMDVSGWCVILSDNNVCITPGTCSMAHTLRLELLLAQLDAAIADLISCCGRWFTLSFPSGGKLFWGVSRLSEFRI